MNINGAVTVQINVTLIVGFTDGTIDTFHIHSDKTNILINIEAKIKKGMENHINDIKDKFETHQFKKSGGTIRSTEKIRIMISQYKPLKGSSYFPLPDKVKNSGACINIKNDDNECFKYCVQCVFYDIINKPHPERMTHYKKLDDKLDWSMLKFPINFNDIDKFEKK